MIIIEENNLVMYSPITTDFQRQNVEIPVKKFTEKLSTYISLQHLFLYKITSKLVGKKYTFIYIQTYWNPIMYCTSRAPSYNSAIICCRKEKFCISPVEGKIMAYYELLQLSCYTILIG